MRTFFTFSILAIMLALLASCALGQVTPVDLGTLPGGSGSEASGINNLGQVVGQSWPTSGNGHAFLWSPGGGMVDLGTLGGSRSWANGINNEGQVVGGSGTASGDDHAFLWSPGGGMVDLGMLPGYAYGDAFAVNDLGQVVGEAETVLGDEHAFLWSPGGGMADLGTLVGSWPTGINNQGQVVGSSTTSSGNSHAFLWSPSGEMIDLGTLGGNVAWANGINNQGQVVGYSDTASGYLHAFLWSPSTGMVDLGTLPGGSGSLAYGINDQGQVVGGATAAPGWHAFIWSPSGGMVDLGMMPGDSQSYAWGINDQGEVVGQCLDSANNLHAVLWRPQYGLGGIVTAAGANGLAAGPLSGATVSITGGGSCITDAGGGYSFTGVGSGSVTITVSATGYYTATYTVTCTAGSSLTQNFQLVQISSGASSGCPLLTGFSSPKGRHFLQSLPGSLPFSANVAWNGSPGSVTFLAMGNSYGATITDLGGGMATAGVSIPAPASVSQTSQLQVRIRPMPPANPPLPTPECSFTQRPQPCERGSPACPGLAQVSSYSFSSSCSLTPWDVTTPNDSLETKASVGDSLGVKYNPGSGTISGSVGWSGGIGASVNVQDVTYSGANSLKLQGTLDVALEGTAPAKVTPSWTLSTVGDDGIEAPAVDVVEAIFPAAAGAIQTAQNWPIVGGFLDALKLGADVTYGGSLSGLYNGTSSSCFLGSSSLSSSLTLGIEGKVSAGTKIWGQDVDAAVYVGCSGSPSFEICPSFQFQGVTLNGYVGLSADAGLFHMQDQIGASVTLGGSGGQSFVIQSVRPVADLAPKWTPIGNRCLKWGDINRPPSSATASARAASTSTQQGTVRPASQPPSAATIVENVTTLASPSIYSDSAGTILLYALHDTNKPWYAATGIASVSSAGDGTWPITMVTNSQTAQFAPRITSVNSNTLLATWTCVTGDISTAASPTDVAPHLDIAAAHFDRTSGTWSAPQQLTNNSVVDRNPVPVVFGSNQGILWVENQGSSSLGNATQGDCLMFAQWNGTNWQTPQTLWSGPMGIMSIAFVADSASQGHMVFVVNQTGDPTSTTNCQLCIDCNGRRCLGVCRAADQRLGR